jgi:hypothetical protein
LKAGITTPTCARPGSGSSKKSCLAAWSNASRLPSETQSLKEVIVEDTDYQTIYAAMKRVSEFSRHDMAAGRHLPTPDSNDMRHDLDTIHEFRLLVQRRKNELRERREALERPPTARRA